MTAVEITAVPVSDLEQRTQLRRAVIASTVGTTIEWYDFLLYGQMAAIIFAKLYFPLSEPLTGTLQAFATYGQPSPSNLRVGKGPTPSGPGRGTGHTGASFPARLE